MVVFPPFYYGKALIIFHTCDFVASHIPVSIINNL